MKLLATITPTKMSAAKIGICYLVAIGILVSACSLFPILPVQAQTETPNSTVMFGADQYQFPSNARDFMPDKAGVIHNMSMRLIYPEMEGLTPSNSKSMRIRGQNNRSIQLLLRDDGLPGEKVVLTPQESLNSQVWHGLTRQQYRSYKIEDLKELSPELALKDFDRVSAYGLDELMLKPEIKVESLDYLRKGMRRGERRFIKTLGKDAKVFIACTSPEIVPNPHCNMWFAFRDIYVKANFVLAMLPEWDGIRNKLSDYFEKYRVKP